MKAVVANTGLGQETWDRVKKRIFRRESESPPVSFDWTDTPEPRLPGPQWVRVRTVMSGISTMDEGMALHHDVSCFGRFLSFPFVPGNENVGIVTDAGPDNVGIELGERVVVDPVLGCAARGIRPPCPSCAAGEPFRCRNFAEGGLAPGVMIGACRDTGGGWGDSFVAHGSQIHAIPPEIVTDNAVLVPELTRAIKTVLEHPPAPDDRVVVVGGGSLGWLTVVALEMLGRRGSLMIAVEHPHEAVPTEYLGEVSVAMLQGATSGTGPVAELIRPPTSPSTEGRATLDRGGDLVYETTGSRNMIQFAMGLAREGQRVVLAGIKQPSGIDATPMWSRGIRLQAVGISGSVTYEDRRWDLYDLALEMIRRTDRPLSRLISHRFRPEEFRKALSVLENRATKKTFKVIIQHVM